MENENKPEEQSNKDDLSRFAPKDSSPVEGSSIPPVEPIASSDNKGGFETPEPASSVSMPSSLQNRLNFDKLNSSVKMAKLEIGKILIGQYDMVDLLLVGILCNGHILLEGVPGIAKTTASKLLSQTLSIDFNRIQFTPDMMPSDVIGTSVFSMKTNEFSFKKGPIFSNIVLIDEINRAPAKTQSALFEVMEERQITYDGERYPMEFPFLVVATQNPVEQEGTYRLPEAQLDRFLFRIVLDYPSLEDEAQILHRFKGGKNNPLPSKLAPVINAKDLKEFQELIEEVKIEDGIIKYIASITHQTRHHSKLYLGGSPRASLSMMKASKALAALKNRDFVTPEDVQFIAPHVLNHRIILNPDAEMEGTTPEIIINEIIQSVEVPR